MIRGLYTSSAGMQVEALRQETIANNLANLNTTGFRRDMAVMEARGKISIQRTNNPTSSDPLGPSKRVPIGQLGTGVLVDRIVKRFESGDLRETENPYDLALTGDGFFTVETPQGERLYTRSGEFTRDRDGRVVDKAGRTLMGQGGPIVVPAGRFQVNIDASVSIDGREVDRLALVNFAEPDRDLEKMGDTDFRYRGTAPPAAANVEVHQGMLEGANVNAVREMVEMIACLRQYEANQKAIHHQDETLQRAVNDIAKF